MLRRGYELDGRTVLITGAARGIGAETARRVIDQGGRVSLLDRDGEELERRAQELGPRAVAFLADVVDGAALEDAVHGTLERFGRIDVAIANAGITGTPSTTGVAVPGDVERVIEVNLLGVWRTLRAALPYVVQGRGYLLATASIASLMPTPLLAPYCASKHGVEGLMRSLRVELAYTGTRVGLAYFSFVDTGLLQAASAEPAAERAMSALPGPLKRAVPVAQAGASITRAIERRATRVFEPAWLRALFLMRGLMSPFDRLSGLHPRVVSACREADSVTDQPGRASSPSP